MVHRMWFLMLASAAWNAHAQFDQDCPLVPLNTFIYHDGQIIGNQLFWVEQCPADDPYATDPFGPIGGDGDICSHCPIDDDPPKPNIDNITITQQHYSGGSISGPNREGRWGNKVTLEASASGGSGIEMRVYIAGNGINGGYKEKGWEMATSLSVFDNTLVRQVEPETHYDEMTCFVSARFDYWPAESTVEDRNSVKMYRNGNIYERVSGWSYPPEELSSVPIFYATMCQGGSPTLTDSHKMSFTTSLGLNLNVIALHL